jgi:hypothetical protein
MPVKHRSGCMRCGAPLTYLDSPRELPCVYCGVRFSADAACEAGHFVCDACHASDGVAAVERICLTTTETDMLALLRAIRRHPAIPMHGPEHHGLVPAVILATYRNLGGADIDDELVRKVIRRGMKIPGGFCGYAGTCGAAVGVGIAFAALTGSTPVKAPERQTALTVTQRVLAAIATREAARCCQRDTWLALRSAADLSRELLPIILRAEANWLCTDSQRNKQCLERGCPLYNPDQSPCASD